MEMGKLYPVKNGVENRRVQFFWLVLEITQGKEKVFFVFTTLLWVFFVILLGSILKDYEDEEGGEGRR